MDYLPSDHGRDAEDIRLLFSGDENSRIRGLTGLYIRYRVRLLRALTWKVQLQDRAEDVLQETFVKVAQSASRAGSTVPTYVWPWLWRIAFNIVIDGGRHNREVPLGEDQSELVAAPPSSAPDAVPPLAYQECLHAALQELGRADPQCAETLRRCHLEGWSVEEAAEFLGRTAGATRTYLCTARKKLRPHVERCWDLLQDLRRDDDHGGNGPGNPANPDAPGGGDDE
jgi:RNA polymerase sigma factor (sigma-70 family)